MSAEPAQVLPLRAVEECPRCEVFAATCDALAAERDAEVRDRTNIEREVRRLLRLKAKLEAELAGQRKTSPEYETAYKVYEFWRRHCMPRARTFGDDRLKAVLGILKAGYSGRYVCESILGYAADPPRRGDIVYLDLTLIARDSSHIERGHETYVRLGGRCQCELKTEEERHAAGLDG